VWAEPGGGPATPQPPPFLLVQPPLPAALPLWPTLWPLPSLPSSGLLPCPPATCHSTLALWHKRTFLEKSTFTRQSPTPVPRPGRRATSKRTATPTSCPVSESCWSTGPALSLLGALEGLGGRAGLLAQAKWQRYQDPNNWRGI